MEYSQYTLSCFPARPRGPTAPTSNAQYTNPRQRPCMNCQETGHSSNDCPLRSGNIRHRGTSEHSGKVSVDFKIRCRFRQSWEINKCGSWIYRVVTGIWANAYSESWFMNVYNITDIDFEICGDGLLRSLL